MLELFINALHPEDKQNYMLSLDFKASSLKKFLKLNQWTTGNTHCV
jgi:hypothetical protein